MALSLKTRATELQQCTVESITNNCKFFSENKNLRIPTGDGTSIFNLFAYQKQEDTDKEAFKDRNTTINQQVQIAQIIDSIPDSRMRPRLKMTLVTNPEMLRDPVRGFDFPWPPQSASGNIRTVEAAELKSARSKIFTKDEIDKLKAIIKFQDIASTDQDKLGVLDANGTISQARLQKIQTLIEFVRAQIIDNILDGRKEETLSVEEKALIKKIRTIQYVNPTDPIAASSEPCKSIVGNAFYSPLVHSFTVCPNIANYPDSTLVQIMAHEFTHSIDPCMSQSGLYKIDHSKLSQSSTLLSGNKSSQEFIKNHNMSANLLQTLTTLPPKIERINFDFSDHPGDSTPAKWLTDHGILSKEAVGISSEQYPFEKQFACLLGDKKSFYRLTETEMNKIADEAVAVRQNQYDKSYNPAEDRKAILTALKIRPECSFSAGSRATQAQEVMADWMSGKVLGSYLKQHPPANVQEKVASISFFAAIGCYEAVKTKETQEKLATESIDAIITKAIAELRDRDKDPHAQSMQRLNELLLTEPEIRKALGCAPLENSCYNPMTADAKKNASKIKTTR